MKRILAITILSLIFTINVFAGEGATKPEAKQEQIETKTDPTQIQQQTAQQTRQPRTVVLRESVGTPGAWIVRGYVGQQEVYLESLDNKKALEFVDTVLIPKKQNNEEKLNKKTEKKKTK